MRLLKGESLHQMEKRLKNNGMERTAEESGLLNVAQRQRHHDRHLEEKGGTQAAVLVEQVVC